MRHDSQPQIEAGHRTAVVTIVVILFFVAGGSTSLRAQDAPDPTRQPDTPGEETSDSADEQTSDETADKRDQTDKLVFELSGYHHFPSRSDLDEIGDAATVSEMLRKLAEDDSRRPSLRLRAVDALAYYTDDDTRQYLESLLEEPSDDLEPSELRVAGLMRHHAIVSLAKAHDGGAVEQLAPLLDHDDVQLRLTVVSALAKHAGQKGTATLEAFRPRANHDLIERELRKYLGDK